MYSGFLCIILVAAICVSCAAAITVGPTLNYQGKLTNSGSNPLTGSYTVTFRVYDAATGGTALSTDTHTVTADKGLFTTAVTIDPAVYDGRALWLGVMVGSDPEMTPRQEIRPVPYSLSLRPGAIIKGSGIPKSLTVSNDDDNGIGIFADMKSPYSYGLFANTTGSYSTGLHAETTGSSSHGFSATTTGPNSMGVYVTTTGANSMGVSGQTSGNNTKGVIGFTTGPNSPALYGESWQDAGVYGKGTEGGYFTTRQAGSLGYSKAGVNVSTSFDYNPAVLAKTTGTISHGVSAFTSGTGSPAIYGSSTQDVGVVGIGKEGGYFTTRQAGSLNYSKAGVNVSTSFDYNPAVLAKTTGTISHGVSAFTSGTGSPAIYGSSTQDVGVVGKGTEGGYFTTRQAGSLNYSKAGVNVSTSYDYNPGVRIKTTGTGSHGVVVSTTNEGSTGVYASTSGKLSEGVHASTSGPYSYGVYASTTGTGSDGVYASTTSDSSIGVNARTTGTGSYGMLVYTTNTSSHGVVAITSGPSSYGVYASTTNESSAGVDAYTTGPDSYGVSAVSVQSYGLYADTRRTDQKYGIYTPDYLFAKGTQVPAADVAEYMQVASNVTPGTVLIIGKGGILKPSAIAYDTHVAGIVSTAPGVSLGTKEDGNPGEALIAVSGKVPCKVDASNGPIEEGDLLTTSDRQGYAMKAEPTMINGRGFYPDGTILGKAMGSLESGTGTIEVLVTLQ